jgi:two-component system phosphate regulon response regulator PhoB
MEKRPIILVVDDEAPIRHVLLDLLADERYQGMEAPDGQIALEMAREHHPDLILMDVMMPGLDGRQTLLALHAEPSLATIPIVLMSAVGHALTRGAGAAAFVLKPFDLDHVLAVIRRVLSDSSTP